MVLSLAFASLLPQTTPIHIFVLIWGLRGGEKKEGKRGKEEVPPQIFNEAYTRMCSMRIKLYFVIELLRSAPMPLIAWNFPLNEKLCEVC